MVKIFRPALDNVHFPLLLKNPKDIERCAMLNFEKLAGSWEPLEFEFFRANKEETSFPDISNTTPCLAIRSDLRESLFPVPPKEIEFLPISVSGEKWLLMNSLLAVNSVNESESILHRSDNGEIFLVQKLVLNEIPSDRSFFTLDGSNRAYTYVLESFVKKVALLGLEGLSFKVVGRAKIITPEQ